MSAPARQPGAQASGGYPAAWDDKLREAGYRSTSQRRNILAAIWQRSHATPEELLEIVRVSSPEVNLSTIYRALEIFGEVGLVTHAHFHHGAVTYHAVDDDPHVHLVCRGCGEVTSAARQLAEPLAVAVLADSGFRADLSHLTLHGWCATCATTGADPGRSASAEVLGKS